MATTEAPKKNRLSRILGGSKREKSPDQPAAFPPDSAYASSDTTPTPGAVSNEQIVPAEKDSDIGNIDKNRNLGVRPSTGEVLDRDTGEVVTVVTTTTTTTTTTTRKPGKKNPEVHKDVDVQEVTQTQPAINPNGISESTIEPARGTGVIAEMPATPGTPGAHAPIQPPVIDTSHESNRLRKQSPGIPAKSANRRSGEFNNSYVPPPSDVSPEGSYFAKPGPTGNTPPISPQRTNFSYPNNRNTQESLDGASLATTTQPQSHSKTTMADLRAAAKGLHGVGETLRGTLNAAVDDNFPRKNTKKADKARAKNEAVLAKGREEVSGIPHRDRTHHNDNTYTSPSHPPPIPQNQPPPMHSYESGYGTGPHSGVATAPPVKPPSPQRTPTAEQTVPGSWSADHDYENAAYHDSGVPHTGPTGGLSEQENREREKSRSISKLFKRKPVAKDGELRDRKYY